MTQALINPTILNWALERAELTEEMLAKKMSLNEERIINWKNGKEKPTFNQAQEIAKKLLIPFGYLFLKVPPKEKELPLPDLRTINSIQSKKYSIDLQDTIRMVIEKQEWYKEYLQDHVDTNFKFIRDNTHKFSVQEIVFQIREKLGFPLVKGSWDDYYNLLVERIESLGILVMRNSVVGANTHRKLSIDEFRGFAIVDDRAPVIFINNSDCPEGRLFTLIHELAHIWIGKSGVSDVQPNATNPDEKICNEIAAEVLVPSDEFESQWINTINWKENLSKLVHFFKVSRIVIARKALDLKKIDLKTYQDFVEACSKEFQSSEKPDFVNPNYVQRNRVSKRFAKAVVSEALSGRLLLRDAHYLIGIKPSKISDFARKELNS